VGKEGFALRLPYIQAYTLLTGQHGVVSQTVWIFSNTTVRSSYICHKTVLSRYATEVDVDFVRKAVRAIGRCAIKVEQSAERCVSTLLDLIQTKVFWLFMCVFLFEVWNTGVVFAW
jgi:Vesicle coat complex, various subunits